MFIWVRVFSLLLNVTCNDISVIYVTLHRCAGGMKKSMFIKFYDVFFHSTHKIAYTY